MKTRKLVLLLAGLACVFVMVVALKTLLRDPHTASGETFSVEGQSVPPARAMTARNLNGNPANTGVAPAADIETVALTVAPGKTLATVNDIAITLKDLLPMSAHTSQESVSLSRERYDFLLQRAIDRELAFQAARERRVGLSDEQKNQLEQVRQSAEARDSRDPTVLSHLNVTGSAEDRLQFELRDATGALLLAALLAREGAPPPHVTAGQVEDYYQTRRHELTRQSAVNAVEPEATRESLDAEIRRRLAPELQQQHQLALDQLLERLKADAKIQTANPKS